MSWRNRRSTKKADANQETIISALRKVGAGVQSLSTVGYGCPDLLVCYRGRTLVMEVKDGTRRPSERKLTTDEANWSATWAGEWHLVECVEDALKAIGLRSGPLAEEKETP